ncbi:MAG: hypothetical protein CVV41_11730 [Candidatus Riflebacteria bacterium HGW-Riflebacteria-1]|nr:MAG: hypothetical protein CVV41_11730 [Candidatus Riflebacteria bacterium HGW-Riflebacteria-1]
MISFFSFKQTNRAINIEKMRYRMRSVFPILKKALAVIFCLTTALAGAGSLPDEEASYRLPDMAVDAERATYQGLISRPHDEIDAKTIELKSQRNPIKLLHAFNASVMFGGTSDGSLRGATVAPTLRGFGGKYTAVTVDGCPVNTGWNGTSPLSGFPLSRMQRVSVVPGGAGLVYGANSVAGAVNFVLPTARDLEGLTLLQEIGGMGTRRQEIIYGDVSHQNEHLFAVFLDEYDGDRKFKDFSNAAVPADNLGTINNRRDNQMFMYRGRLELDNGLVLKATILENYGSISCPSYYERFDPWKMSLYDYVLEKDLGKSGNLTLRYAKYRDFSSTYAYANTDKDMMNGILNVNSDVLVKVDTMELLYNVEANSKNFVTFGAIKQEIEDIGHGFQTGNRKKVDTSGFFINDSIKATDKLDLNLTARSDKSYEGDSNTSWAFASNYDISDRTSFGLGLSSVVRNPNMQELYRDKNRGNPDLAAEEADNLELRLGHKFNSKWQASFAWFRSDIENYIEADAKNTFQNIQEVAIDGVEFSVNGKVNERFDVWIGYTDFNKAQNKTNNVRLSSRPEYRAVAGTAYRYEKFSAMLTTSYQGETNAIGATYPKVDSSTFVDLSLRQQATKDFAVYLNIENLTDQDEVQLSQSTGAAAYDKAGKLNLNQSSPINYEPGRSVTFGLELKFR